VGGTGGPASAPCGSMVTNVGARDVDELRVRALARPAVLGVAGTLATGFDSGSASAPGNAQTHGHDWRFSSDTAVGPEALSLYEGEGEGDAHIWEWGWGLMARDSESESSCTDVFSASRCAFSASRFSGSGSGARSSTGKV